MPEIESGFRWWARYVLVPLVGGGGLIAVVVATIDRYKGSQPAPSAAVSAAPADRDAINEVQTPKDVVKSRAPVIPDPTDTNSVTIRSEYEKLRVAILSGNPASVQAARETLVRILTAAHIQFDSSASAFDLLKGFQQAIIASDDDDTKVAALTAAVKSLANQ